MNYCHFYQISPLKLHIVQYVTFQTTQTHGLWIIFDVITMTEQYTLLHDRLWAGIQVSMCSSACRNKQIAPQKNNWDADSFVTAKNMKNCYF